MTPTKRVAEVAERLRKIKARNVYAEVDQNGKHFAQYTVGRHEWHDLVLDVRLLAAHVAKGNLTARKRKGAK